MPPASRRITFKSTWLALPSLESLDDNGSKRCPVLWPAKNSTGSRRGVLPGAAALLLMWPRPAGSPGPPCSASG